MRKLSNMAQDGPGISKTTAIWLSGTEFSDCSPGRNIPPEERLTQEEKTA